jgi:hypothetical protein
MGGAGMDLDFGLNPGSFERFFDDSIVVRDSLVVITDD